MESRGGRPRVFVSSTIRDMKDVRSALKFWLEQFGYEVLLSDFNDFDRKPDQGTFDSCFEAISSCDYYILLVGGNKGSEYSPGVSVTQQEYRVAAELAQQGRIKLVVFVRHEVLNALAELVQDADGNLLTADRSVLKDPEFVRQLVAEIRATEVGRRGEDPSGTVWTYPFDDFQDLADALRINLRLYGTVRKKSLLENLAWELQDIISVFCSTKDGAPDCGLGSIDPLRIFLGEELAKGAYLVSLDAAQSGSLMTFFVIGMPLESSIQTIALQDAISSGEFLQFDRAQERPINSPELDAMLELRRDIERYRVNSKWAQNKLPEFEPQWQGRRQIDLTNVDIALVLAIPDLIQNILRRSMNLLDYIASEGATFVPPELVVSAPFGSEVQARAAAEKTTHDAVDAWRRDPEMRRIVSGG